MGQAWFRYKAVYVLQADAQEAERVEGIDVYLVKTLARLVTHFRDYPPIEIFPARGAELRLPLVLYEAVQFLQPA